MKKLTVKQLFELGPLEFKEYHEVLKYLEPSIPEISKRKLTSLSDLSYGKVAIVRAELRDQQFESILSVFKTVFKIKRDITLELNIVTFYQALNWLQEELKTISEREKSFLSSDSDPVLKEAGIDRLSIFGDLNPLISLAKQYSKSPEEIGKWNYNLVFSLLLHDKIRGEVDKEYQRLKSQPREPR